MRIKDYLRQENKEINEKILESEPEEHRKLFEQHFENQNSEVAIKKVPIRNITIVACLIVIMVGIIGLFAWWISPKDNKVYYRENEITKIVELDEVLAVSPFGINNEIYKISSPQCIVDEPTSEILYYALRIQQKNGLIDGKIYLVTNLNYDFILENAGDVIETCTWKGYKIEYSFSRTSINDLPMITVSGSFSVNEMYRIYFMYSDLDVYQEYIPSNFLESSLVAK